MVTIRPFRQGDELALHAVFHSAVHTLATQHYSAEQLEAWAPQTIDVERWTARMRSIRPFIAEEDGRILGYADVQGDGTIDHFFVSGDRARGGVGTLLMKRIHEQAASLRLTALFADVSRTAQPFFERFGFRVVEQRTVAVRGVAMANARMRKELEPACAAG